MADALDRLLAAAGQLGRLIDDLLDLSRIEAGHMHYEVRQVKLEEIVGQVIRELAGRVTLKRLSIHFTEPDPTAPLAMVDPDKIYEVVINLVDNAIAYSTSGTIDISVRPTGTSNNSTVTLSVT